MLSLSEARRIALTAQGFHRPRPQRAVTMRDVRLTIHRLGLLQIDYVNVLGPSHYQVLFSRLGPYRRALLDALIDKREFTEQWAHEASIVPIAAWPLLRYRRDTHRPRPWGFDAFLNDNAAYSEALLDQVRERGPLSAAGLPVPEGVARRMGHTWFSTVPRAVLEAHFGRGVLAVARRLPNFARQFDLAERIIPAEHHGRTLSREESQRELLRLAASSYGIATAADLADYYRMPVKEAGPRLAELVEAGALQPARVEGWREVAYLPTGTKIPPPLDARALLSPFDPVVWYRPRAARLFEFDYRLEIFFPAAQRRWGYYVLPFLLGERLAARVDLKADRAASLLLVRSAHLEQHADAPAVAHALSAELRALASWYGLASVQVASQTRFARLLRAAIPETSR
jgi:uncharacterized protein YcaQ